MTRSRRTYRSRTLFLLRFPIAGLVCIAIGTLVVSLIVIGLTSETSSAHSSIAPATPAQTRPIGIPAIHPPSSVIGNTAVGAGASPTFTINDAEAYVKTHAIPKAIAVHGTLRVAQADFMSSRAASTILNGESTGLPDDATVCYVELHGGTVDFGGPPGTVVTFSKVFELFDAQSGNLLMSGGLN